MVLLSVLEGALVRNYVLYLAVYTRVETKIQHNSTCNTQTCCTGTPSWDALNNFTDIKLILALKPILVLINTKQIPVRVYLLTWIKFCFWLPNADNRMARASACIPWHVYFNIQSDFRETPNTKIQRTSPKTKEK